MADAFAGYGCRHASHLSANKVGADRVVIIVKIIVIADYVLLVSVKITNLNNNFQNLANQNMIQAHKKDYRDIQRLRYGKLLESSSR